MGGQDTDLDNEATGAFKLPSKAALKAASDRKNKQAAHDGESRPGRVVGLDYAMWASAIVDLSDPVRNEMRIKGTRRRLANKGYVLLEGAPVVDGFESAEVWIKSRGDWLADREQRTAKIREAQRRGYMSDTALSMQEISGPHGKHWA